MKLLKKQIKEKPAFGTLIVGNSPVIVEDYANYDFDYVNFDLMHSEMSLSDCRMLFLTCEHWGIVPVVSVSENSGAEIRKALEMGAQALVIPGIRDGNDAAKAVSAAKFPPFPGGERSYSGSVRCTEFGGCGFDPAAYVRESNENQMLLVSLDNRGAVEKLDEILAVPGIDGVYLNPEEYQLIMGDGEFYIADFNKKILQEAVSRIRTACEKAGTIWGASVHPADYETVRTLVDDGARLLTIGSDTKDFQQAADEIKETLVDPLQAFYALED